MYIGLSYCESLSTDSRGTKAMWLSPAKTYQPCKAHQPRSTDLFGSSMLIVSLGLLVSFPSPKASTYDYSQFSSLSSPYAHSVKTIQPVFPLIHGQAAAFSKTRRVYCHPSAPSSIDCGLLKIDHSLFIWQELGKRSNSAGRARILFCFAEQLKQRWTYRTFCMYLRDRYKLPRKPFQHQVS